MRQIGCFPFLLGVCLLAALAAPASTRASGQEGKELVIRLPAEINPSKVTILCGQYGYGLALGPITTKRGVYEYSQKLSEKTTSVKVLVYCAGYKMVAAEIAAKDISPKKPFAPRLERVAMIPLTVRLADSKGKPLAGEKVSVVQGLFEMEFFGYYDGMVFPVTVATVVTDANGEFSAEVPSLLDDPYFVKWNRPPGFGIHLAERERRSEHGGYDLVNGFIAAQRSYPQPLTVTLVYRGRISGHVHESYLSRHGIKAPMGPLQGDTYLVSFMAYSRPRRSGSGRGVGKDGSFSISLAPGAYDLTLEVRDEDKGFTEKRIPIQQDFVLSEGEDKAIELE